MPKVNCQIDHEPLYTDRKFGEPSNVTFIDQLDAIKVTFDGSPNLRSVYSGRTG